jgi:hypothetical protein
MELNWVTIVFAVPIIVVFLIGIGNSMGLLDLDFDHDFDHDIDHNIHHEPSSVKDSFLDLFGFGRVPFSIILLTMNMVFSITGFVSSMVLQSIFKFSIIYGPISIFVALAATVLFTGKICKAIGKIIPSSESYVRSADDLIGKEGIAYTDIDTKFGVAQVRDENKMLHKVICQSCSDNIIDGTKIIVLEYNIDTKIYKVIPLSELTKN